MAMLLISNFESTRRKSVHCICTVFYAAPKHLLPEVPLPNPPHTKKCSGVGVRGLTTKYLLRETFIGQNKETTRKRQTEMGPQSGRCFACT